MTGQPSTSPLRPERQFDKKRGVSHVEVRSGFAQIHVTHLSGDLTAARIGVLRAVAEAEVSIDFLKITPTGLSFLVSQESAADANRALKDQQVEFSLRSDRSIVLVHAVNIRDEDGLIASIMKEAISSGAIIDHIGDMHDRVLMVVSAEAAEPLAEHLRHSTAVRQSASGEDVRAH